tara:strand:+ start:769 stop:1680 length:912 start_codon:yes stop_codon:yes gene_type:complete
MAYRPHPRHMTDQQFSDATTIDGSRIDSAMEDIERHFNDVPQGDIRTKWTPSSYVMSWCPTPIAAVLKTHNFPWMKSVNDPTEVVGVNPDSFANPFRVKGFDVPGITPQLQAVLSGSQGMNRQYHSTVGVEFSRPAIITHIDVMLLVDDRAGRGTTSYANTYQYGATKTPPGFNANANSKDFNFTLQVDAPTGPEDRQLNPIEMMRHDWTLNMSQASNIAWPAAGSFSDMTPSGFPSLGFSGVVEKIKGPFPIHRSGRVRLTLTIPPSINNASADRPYDSSWGTEPWAAQQFNITMHVLEELV